MEHPEPFKVATETLVSLKRGEYFCMLHRRIPYPLFEFCQGLSLQYEVKEGVCSAYEIIIYFEADATALKEEGIL